MEEQQPDSPTNKRTFIGVAEDVWRGFHVGSVPAVWRNESIIFMLANRMSLLSTCASSNTEWCARMNASTGVAYRWLAKVIAHD